MIVEAIDAGIVQRRARVERLLLPALVAAVIAACLCAVALGAVSMSPLQVVAIIAQSLGLDIGVPFDARQEHVLLVIRLPRVLMGLAIGMGLGMAGAAMQGIYRNPLADPGLIGTSSGAAFGASTMVVLGAPLSMMFGKLGAELMVPAAAFAGGLAASVVVYRFARQRLHGRAGSMIMAGVAVNAIAGAGTGLVTYLANDAQLRSIVFWSMGALGGATWKSVVLAVPLIALALVLLPRAAVRLDALLLGDAEAAHLGVDVARLRRMVVGVTALAVGAAVAVAGAIGFIGLVAPHIVRMLIGPSHRRLLPGAALLGGLLLVLGDIVARTIVSPTELPIGIITAFMGAPVLIALVARHSRGEESI